MDSQEDPRRLTLVQGNEDLDSEHQTEIFSPNHGLRTEDSVMNLHRQIHRPVLQHQLDSLTEEDEDVDYPPPRLITGLPEYINVDDHNDDNIDDTEPNNPETFRPNVPCLQNTTEEVKDYILYLETTMDNLYSKLKEAHREFIAFLEDQIGDKKRINQQEEELTMYREFFKTNNERVDMECDRPKSPPDQGYVFGRKLRIQMNHQRIDPDIKSYVDGRIQDILERTQSLDNQEIQLSPRSSSPSIDTLTPTTPIYKLPLQFRDTDTSLQDPDESTDRNQSVPTASNSSENVASQDSLRQGMESAAFEICVPSKDANKINEQTVDTTPTSDLPLTNHQLLEKDTHNNDTHIPDITNEFSAVAESNELKTNNKSKFQQDTKESREDDNDCKWTEQLGEQHNRDTSHLNDLVEMSINPSTSHDEQFQPHEMSMTQEEQQLIEELENYVNIETQAESQALGKIPYVDMNTLPSASTLEEETTNRTKPIAGGNSGRLSSSSIDIPSRESIRKTPVETWKRRQPVQFMKTGIAQKLILPPIDTKKAIDSKAKTTKISLSEISTASSAIKPPLQRGVDRTLLIGGEKVSKKKQMNRHDVLPQIRTEFSRKHFQQDSDTSSLSKLNSANNVSNSKYGLKTTKERIVLPKIKSTVLSTSTVSKPNLRHGIKSNILPDKPKPGYISSNTSTVASRPAKTCAEKSGGLNKIANFKRPKVLLPVQTNRYQSNRRKEIRPTKLPPICNLGLDDSLALRKD